MYSLGKIPRLKYPQISDIGMNRAITLLIVACLSLSSVAFGAAADETQDIPANAQATGVHDALVAALGHAGLVETLQGDGPFTVFAPTDEAFTAAGIDLSTFDNDEANATLSDILLYHVVSGAVDAANVTDGMVATMVNGDNATFTVNNGSVMINDANVTTADVSASNGIIHVIDKVLMPPADEPQPQDIPTVATNTGVHASLVAALAHAGLVETLQGDGPFTVFAPTDDAFTAAGIDLSTFDNDEANATLADILKYHVYAGSVAAADVTDGMVATMVNGDNATFTVSNGTVTVGGATVTTADVAASNGIIHVIDKVLTPPADEPVVEEPEEVDPFAGITCAATIGIDTSGYAFSPTVVNIAVGETVCWSWEDASMPHNVKQVDGFKSTTYTPGGVTSGAAASTVAFSHTFTEDTTFYYACEPHIGLDMFGEVVVGDGGSQPAADTTDESEDTPGFMVISTVIAVIGALALMGRQNQRDL
jgi:uncharacterized surface protein with fasciclin (FAS1) repeats/plastocyanin